MHVFTLLLGVDMVVMIKGHVEQSREGERLEQFEHVENDNAIKTKRQALFCPCPKIISAPPLRPIYLSIPMR